MPRSSAAHDRRRLTSRQVDILTIIRAYQRSHGCSPTMQEIADRIHVTKVTVFEHVETLVAKGLLRRLPHKARSLELTSRVALPDDRSTVFPVVGYIAAGLPIEAIENRETIDLEDFFNTHHSTFVLKVRGDSMIDEQIRDGDYVVCEKRSEPRRGETVVALLDSGEATLKKFYREKGKIRLQPANPDFEPIVVEPGAVEIQGIVVGILRTY